MNPTDDTDQLEDLEVETAPVRAVRLTFMGSLGFWPLFLFATSFMLPAVGKAAAAVLERRVLVDSTWLYPVAVLLAWYLCKRGKQRGSTDLVCILPYVIPALFACYWPVYFLL